MATTTGYYRLAKKMPNCDVPVGELWYLTGFDGSRFQMINGTSQWNVSPETLQECFVFAPNGRLQRQQQIADLMAEVEELTASQEVAAIGAEPVLALPAPNSEEIEAEFSVIEEQQETTEREIIRVNEQSPAIMGGKIKVMKSNLAKTKVLINRVSTELQRLLKEQELILKEKVDALTSAIEVASDYIYILNSYLGKGEELVKIKEGPRADANEPIVVRQLVLYMDEEIAAAEKWSNHNSFDFTKVESFDEWVSQPENLQQVLPDKRGIVAIKPRFSNKEYSKDLWINEELNKANKCLYILVRNGDMLYRIYTDLHLEDVLFPRKREFDEMFYETVYDHEQDGYVKQPIQPGSFEYERKMKKSQKAQRRYYAVLMLIQGIFDRTKVFEPLPPGRANIANIFHTSENIIFLYDAENILGDGRPTFDQWVTGINSQIDVGSRVIGLFDDWNLASQMDFSKYNVRPRNSGLPSSKEIYVLEGKEGNRFLFRFKSRSSNQRRATFLLSPGQKYYLHYDRATVEDMKYYCSSRLHRRGYADMLPLLNLVINMKEAEKKEEAAFRKLLIGQIMKTHKVSLDAAEGEIDSLIDWWKLKNKIHRALKSNDKKALRMIVDEFGGRLRLRASADDSQQQHKETVELILSKTEDALAVFLRKDGEITVYRYCNDENIFVHEERWKGKKPKRVDEQRWKLVDNWHLGWQLLWSHERWINWNVNMRRNRFVSDEEIDRMVEFGLQEFANNPAAFRHWEAEGRKDWMKIVAVKFLAKEQQVIFYYLAHAAHIPNKLFERAFQPEMAYFTVSAKRTKAGFEPVLEPRQFISVWNTSLGRKPRFDNMPWDEDYRGVLPAGRYKGRIIKVDGEIMRQVQADFEKLEEYRDACYEAMRPVQNCEEQIYQRLREIWLERIRKQFDEEFIDDEEGTLWEDKLESLHEPEQLWPRWFQAPAKALFEQGFGLNGKTVAEVIELGKKQKKIVYDEKEWVRYYKLVQDLVLDTSFDKKVERLTGNEHARDMFKDDDHKS